MNTKLLLGFLGGVLAASGVAYLMSHHAGAPEAAQPAVAASTVSPASPANAVSSPPDSSPQRTDTSPAAPVPPTRTPVTRTPSRSAAHPPATKPAQSSTTSTSSSPALAQAQPPVAPPEASKPVETAVATPAPVTPAPAPSIDPASPPERSESKVEPPPSNSVTLQRGVLIPVRLGETLSSKDRKPGDTFIGALDQPLVIDGFVIAEKGARVEGRVAESQEAGRVKGLAQLSIELTRITTSDNQKIGVRTAAFLKQGPESKGEDAAKVGIGAALGAIIGAAAGGGKGAGIGAAAGGAAGAGTVAATRGKPAVLPVETLISFRIEEPVTITEQQRR